MRLILNQSEGTWRLMDMEEIHVQLLHQVADDASIIDHPEGRARLFPAPIDPKNALPEGEFLEDWSEFVTDDLDQQFAGDVGTLLADLDSVKTYRVDGDEGEERYLLDLPLDHGRAWFSAFNQARLVLDLKYKLHTDDEELDLDEPPDEFENVEAQERFAAHMRCSFYEVLQEWIVRHVL